MLITSFKRLLIVFFLCTVAIAATAQQDHFIYLQTENTQPFYVKVNKKLISSSAMGYLIIPKLNDGNYTVSIGFPKNEFPEEAFSLSVNNKNEGYLIKNFGEKGWGLFNLQSYAVVMSGTPVQKETVLKNVDNDPFSKMLATVVKDSSILQRNELLNERPVRNDSSKIAISNAVMPGSTVDQSTSVINDSTNIATANNIVVDTIANRAEIQSALLLPAKKLLSKKNKDGMEMVYIDQDVNKNDTVRIFIPVDKEKASVLNNASNTVQTQNTTELQQQQTDSAKKVLPSDSKAAEASAPVFIGDINSAKTSDSVEPKTAQVKRRDEIQQDHPNQIVDSTASNIEENGNNQDKMVVLPKVVQSSAVNSDCKSFADNSDFLKLRKKMASASSEDAMIKLATKSFHNKCYSTEQIKNLSLLFLTNEGKYRFFDVAYPFTSDSNSYFTLQSELTDSYYINRFKAMIHK